MFNKSLIKQRVTEVINQRIREAEEKYLSKCGEIDKDSELKKQIHLDSLVEQIVGK